MEGLSREMGEWSLSDEAGDMRGARRELDGHEARAAEAQRAARARDANRDDRPPQRSWSQSR